MVQGEVPGAIVHGGVRSYRLVHPLGQPRLGAGWRALTTGAGGERLVAIRYLPVDVGADAIARLRDEARVLVHLRHRGVLKVEDVVELGDRFAAVLEWGEGTQLADLLTTGAMPARAAVEMSRDLAWALHTAHSAIDPENGEPLQLAHRDLRLQTVLLTRPADARLLDFGLARLRRRGVVLESDSAFVPPELKTGRDLPAGDVYALAMVTVAAVLGRPPGPPSSHGDHAVWVQHLIAEAGFRGALARCLASALDADPDARPDAGTFARACRDEASHLGATSLGDWLERALTLVTFVQPSIAPSDVPDPSLLPPMPSLSEATPGRISVKRVARPAMTLPPPPVVPVEPPRNHEVWDALGDDLGRSAPGPSRSVALLWAVLAGGGAFVLMAGLLVGAWLASRTGRTPVRPDDAALLSFTGPAGTLRVGGDPADEDWARRIRLVDDGGKAWSAGPLPAGTYTLDVTGIELPLTPAVVTASAELRVLCSDPLRKCWVESKPDSSGMTP